MQPGASLFVLRSAYFLLAMLGCLLVAPASAQERTDMGDLKSQVQELKEMVQQLQQETVASRAEITRLRGAGDPARKYYF